MKYRIGIVLFIWILLVLFVYPFLFGDGEYKAERIDQFWGFWMIGFRTWFWLIILALSGSAILINPQTRREKILTWGVVAFLIVGFHAPFLLWMGELFGAH